MIKKLFQFILWQDIEKPKTKGAKSFSTLFLVHVLVLLALSVGVVFSLEMNSFIRVVLLAYLTPNILFLGASRGISFRNEPPPAKEEESLLAGGKLTIFYTFIHVINYLRNDKNSTSSRE